MPLLRFVDLEACLKFLSTIELKFFLYVQSVCLIFAVVGLSLREFCIQAGRYHYHWSYFTILLLLLAGFLLQICARNRVRFILICLTVTYAIISVILTVFVYIRH